MGSAKPGVRPTKDNRLCNCPLAIFTLVQYQMSLTSSDEFIDQVQRNWRERFQAAYSSDSALKAYCRQVKTCTQLAMDSLEKDSQKRPDIVYITKKLNEIEIDIGQKVTGNLGASQNGCHETVSGITKVVTGQHQNTNLRTGPSCNEMEFVDAGETSSDVVEEFIVGREKEKENIMAHLLEGMSKRFTIFSIYGIGGIGMTTFARLICNDPKFKCYSRLWVDVTQRFDLNKIRDSINSQLSRTESQANDTHMLHCSLTDVISHNKKVLIVLDDLWEDNQFQLQELKDMLYHGYSNVFILVTTRSELVADGVCTNLQPYKILPLTNDMCWDIIKRRSGFEDRDDKEMLMGIGREIAQKCGGVALAALSLGFTLRSINFDQWMKVKDSDIWNESISNDFSLSNHLLASLKLSYSYMSPCLKTCFTYCAVFPKGHKIFKNDLVYQWISLDFVKPTRLLSNMQLCEKHIRQLLGLSFFQYSVPSKTSEVYHERTTWFAMHDLVHDLAISVLGNQILDQSKQGHNRGCSCQYALLSDCSWPLEFCLTSRARLIALRFLDCRRTEICSAAFAPAKSLLVLDLSECSLQVLPDSIGQLKQLRYLNAPGIHNLMLPECITKLSNLIFLNLHNSNIRALPKSIGELKRLMHIDLSNCYGIKLPISFKNLENLVHLDLSDCGSISGLSELLWSLSRLEHLNIKYCRHTGDLTGQLGRLKKLQYLNISRYTSDDENVTSGLSQVLINLTKLRHLSVQNCLDETGNDILLECICNLSHLEHLDLSRTGNLSRIPESLRNLRKLGTLNLHGCNKLERLPGSISEIDSLKYLDVSFCPNLDNSTLPQYKNTASLLSHFVVHAGNSSSNLCYVEYENPTSLEIIRLENVMSAEEAQRIKLVEKHRIQNLKLLCTRDAKRFVDDTEVLRQLVPPDTVTEFKLQGYDGVSIPYWMMDIATYLPRLQDVTLKDFHRCNNLPPLGQLPNLKHLAIRGMDSITRIAGDFYGCRRAFGQLRQFSLSRMESLEEWNMPHSGYLFPKLRHLYIMDCPKLRFQSNSPLGHNYRLWVRGSGKLILSSLGDTGHVSAPTNSAATNVLVVECCEVPLHMWSLLRLLPHLKELWIKDCSDLTCSSSDMIQCLSSTLRTLSVTDSKSISALPEWLGYLTSLRKLEILNCEGIKSLPESIQLIWLYCLKIGHCPELVKWCKSGDNMMKLAHIREIILDGEKFNGMRRKPVTDNLFPTTSSSTILMTLQNKGAPTRKMEDLKNTTRDAIGNHMNHPMLALSKDQYGFSKAKDYEIKYECVANLKQKREIILELSKEFGRLTANDDKRSASGIGSTAPGTQIAQRGRKSAAELIRCKGRTASPPTPPVAGPSAAGSSRATPLVSRLSNTTRLQCSASPPTNLGSMYTFTATACPLPLPLVAISKDENKEDGKVSETFLSEESLVNNME